MQRLIRMMPVFMARTLPGAMAEIKPKEKEAVLPDRPIALEAI